MDGVEATSTKVTAEAEEGSESFTEKVPNLFPLKLDSETKSNDVLDLLQNNLNKEGRDEANTFEAENNVATTIPNRRLPEFYPGALSSCSFFRYIAAFCSNIKTGMQRKKTTVPPSTKPQVFAHKNQMQARSKYPTM